MKAVLVRAYGPFEAVRVEECPDPVPGPGEAIVDVEAIDVNYPDILAIAGLYQFKPPLPFTPGKAAAGRIAALGPGVDVLEIGQRVATQIEYGTYTTRLRVPACNCYPIPDAIDTVEAAALVLAYQTSWFALTERARICPGESVLVLGASGGVGVAAVQLAKALGAGLVVGATRGSGKAATIRQAGADHVLDLSQPNLRDGLREQMRGLTGGKGVDIVVDCVGGAAGEAALRALAWRGRLIVGGFAAGAIPNFPANYLLVRNIAVIGLQVSDYRDRQPLEAARAQAEIFRLRTEGRFEAIVSDVLPLESFAEALAKLRDGRAEGKVVLDTRL